MEPPSALLMVLWLIAGLISGSFAMRLTSIMGRHWLYCLSLFLLGGLLLGAVETAQNIAQRSGSPQVAGGWMLAQIVLRVPPGGTAPPVGEIFYNSSELHSVSQTLWIENETHPRKVLLFQAPST